MTHGFLLGKFMPPHSGHKFLVDFAAKYADELTVLVCSHKSEPIPGNLRYAWMKEAFPNVNVVHLDKELPQEPSEHPDFWNIWKKEITHAAGKSIDYVFASETYGARIAQEVGAAFVPVDLGREQMPITATQIRENPYAHWDMILPAARPYFTKKVCAFGPESTGKTTLTRKLAAHYSTSAAMEYGRLLLQPKKGVCEYEDISLIAKGQEAAEEALIKQANKVFFTDTDALTTTIWSDVLFGKVPSDVTKLAEKRTYDLYLLSDIDVPWVDDKERYLPHKRQEFFARCKNELEKRQRPYVLIHGDWQQRFDTAVHAVDALLDGQRLGVAA